MGKLVALFTEVPRSSRVCGSSMNRAEICCSDNVLSQGERHSSPQDGATPPGSCREQKAKKGTDDEELGDYHQYNANSPRVPRGERAGTGRGNAAQHPRVRRWRFWRRRIGLHKLWQLLPEGADKGLDQSLFQRDWYQDPPGLTNRLRQNSRYGRERSGDLGCGKRQQRLRAPEYSRATGAA